MADYIKINSSNIENTVRAYEEKNKSELGKDAFMKILVAQMANQDPMEPMKDQDFIAQMATFTSLENMQSMNSTMTMNNAYSMIGKFVSFIDPGTGKEIAGKVESVFMESGEPRLQVGDFVLKMKGILSVYDADVFKNIVTPEPKPEPDPDPDNDLTNGEITGEGGPGEGDPGDLLPDENE